jgi:hypothetical protein
MLQIFIALKSPLPLAGVEPVVQFSGKHANHYTTKDDFSCPYSFCIEFHSYEVMLKR